MARYVSPAAAARHFNRHPRTIENWLTNRYITGYSDGGRSILVDLEEIEVAFQTNPRMRDGRKPYGGRARIVPLPIQPEAQK